MRSLSEASLHSFLEDKTKLYNKSSFIQDDPVSIPHLFSKQEDIEISAFLTATISWGQRKTILKNAHSLIERMDGAPHQFILSFKNSDLLSFKKFKHRTFNGDDCIFFLKSLKNIYKKHEGLEQLFRQNQSTENQMKQGIQSARKAFFSIPHEVRQQKHFSDPERGSAAKRLNMFLRWMVRKDEFGVDLGVWKNISSSILLCPLDVHSGRVARKLGLLQRKQDDWQAVIELTDRLKRFDPKDPVNMTLHCLV